MSVTFLVLAILHFLPDDVNLRHHYWQDAMKPQTADQYCFYSVAKNQHFDPVGKIMCWIQKWLPPFRIDLTSSTTMQSLGEIEQFAPAVGAKIWCLYVFCLSWSDADMLFVRGCIVWLCIVSGFMGRFWCCFTVFLEGITLSDALETAHIGRQVAPQCLWNCGRKLWKHQKLSEKFVCPTLYR